MSLYQALKILHIISASVLFGTGMGTALYMLYANILKDISLITLATRRVVRADGLFTGISGVVQPISGLAMLYLKKYSWHNPWAIRVLIAYAIAGICWLIVVYLQIRCRNLAEIALAENKALPRLYYRYFYAWIILGIPAFSALLLIFYWMANNPFYG